MSSPSCDGTPPLVPGADNAAERLFLHAMLDSSPDHIYFKDTKSRFLRINRALAAYFGLSDPSEAVGKTDFDFHSREKAEVRFRDEHCIMETGTPIIDKIERQEKLDGKTVWVLTSKSPMYDGNGRLIGTFGMSRDITMLKEMEDALWHERKVLRNVIDHLPDFIFAKDIQGRYTLNNAAHIRFLGAHSQEEVVGKGVFDLFPDGAAEIAHRDDRMVMESGRPMFNKPESPSPGRWLLTSKIPLANSEGEIAGLVGISRDITEQKHAQERLEEANRELRQSREELVHALEELRAVQLELVEAEKMKLVGRLAAGVAHEVKNPLAIITLGLEYLNGQKFADPAIPSILEEIAAAVERADSVVRELLDFSAPKKMNFAPANVNELVRHALRLVRGELASRKVALEEELAAELPHVRLDAIKIEQVLVNLFTNAAHAMEQGGGRLTVRTFSRKVTGIGGNISQSDAVRPGVTLVTIEVLDTGPGVPEAQLGKVFEPFFTTKPTGKGTGLGLTVAKTIIDLHGGTIEIGNRPEGGACASITLNADGD